MQDSIGKSAEVGPEWDTLLNASNDLIKAVERAAGVTGTDFANRFRKSQIEIGDDYPFLDPTLGGFEYVGSKVRLKEFPSARIYVAGIAGCLGRIVDELATANHGERFRERVAVELALMVRMRPAVFAPFTTYLDRIAGTRVL
ncbi:MAG TPA: hypothetical protein VJ124_21915 [Pyrinomonadaceae bacterium]|nr:hypothetical protein [Pyrinomonadaceae bacterium]